MPSKPRPTFETKNETQKEFSRLADDHSYVFQIGPAGTGKTFAAVAKAVALHKAKRIHKIIICRPAVGAGESNGFTPGTLEEKLAAWLRPIYAALEKAGGPTYRNGSFVEFRTFEHMRGDTLDDAAIVVDEAQNCSYEQLKMVLTRLGEDSKMFISGDLEQCDLRPRDRGGLELILRLLAGDEDFPVVTYCDSDNLRHPLVGKLTRIFSQHAASLVRT